MRISTYIKRKINSFVRILGYEIKGVKKIVKHNDFDAIIKFLLKDKDENQQIFFDIGANLGQSINRFKKINIKSQIHSFEPTPNLFELLKKNFGEDQSIKLNNLGVADVKGVINFYAYKYHKINSAVPVDKKSKFSKSRKLNLKTVSEKENFEEIIKINVTSIDEYCDKESINEIDLIVALFLEVLNADSFYLK